MGRVIGAERPCSYRGGHPDQCHEPAQLISINDDEKNEVLASEYNGRTFWRMGELISRTTMELLVNAAGNVSPMLSRDEKTLYLTFLKTLVAFDIGRMARPRTSEILVRLKPVE
jgi:hypothetical protein